MRNCFVDQLHTTKFMLSLSLRVNCDARFYLSITPLNFPRLKSLSFTWYDRTTAINFEGDWTTKDDPVTWDTLNIFQFVRLETLSVALQRDYSSGGGLVLTEDTCKRFQVFEKLRHLKLDWLGGLESPKILIALAKSVSRRLESIDILPRDRECGRLEVDWGIDRRYQDFHLNENVTAYLDALPPNLTERVTPRHIPVRLIS